MASELDLPVEQVSVAKTVPDLLARRLQPRVVGRRLQTDLLVEYVIVSPSAEVADLHARIEANVSTTLGASIAAALEAEDPVAFAAVSVDVGELLVEAVTTAAPADPTNATAGPTNATAAPAATTTPAPAGGWTWTSAAYYAALVAAVCVGTFCVARACCRWRSAGRVADFTPGGVQIMRDTKIVSVNDKHFFSVFGP